MARFTVLTASVLAFALPTVAVAEVEFGEWKRDPANPERQYCEYTYPSKTNPEIRKTQVMLWYPDDAVRKGYYYFANEKNEIWGRCLCEGHPDYEEGVMQWSVIPENAPKTPEGKLNWRDLPKGECPAPKNADPFKGQVGKIPLPVKLQIK